MIARIWHAQAAGPGADAYQRHFTGAVLPELKSIAGFRGAYLLLERSGEGVGIQVVSLWESMEAVGRFAGDDPGVAVVGPAAQAVLTAYDRTVSHHEVVVAAWSGPH